MYIRGVVEIPHSPLHGRGSIWSCEQKEISTYQMDQIFNIFYHPNTYTEMGEGCRVYTISIYVPICARIFQGQEMKKKLIQV